MIGKTCVKGCAPLGGWWTDLNKAVRSGVATAADILTAYKAGNITQEQYIELEKARIAASGGASSDKTILYVGLGAVALVGVVLLTSKRK